jgi:hypothetical protein
VLTREHGAGFGDGEKVWDICESFAKPDVVAVIEWCSHVERWNQILAHVSKCDHMKDVQKQQTVLAFISTAFHTKKWGEFMAIC